MESKLTLVRQYPIGPGGAERYVALLTEGLLQRGYPIQLLCADCPLQTFSEKKGLTIIRLDPYGWTHPRWLRPWFFPWLVQRWLQKHPQSFVFSLDRNWGQNLLRTGDGVHAEWIAQRKRDIDGLFGQLAHLGPYHQLTIWSEKKAYHPQRSCWVLANSEMVKKQIVQRFQFPENRIEVIYNGVDTKKWKPEPNFWLREKLELGKEDLVALFVGTGWQRKGLHQAIAAVETWQRKNGRLVRLAVAGKGPKWQYQSPVVRFFGAIPSDQLIDFYQGADVLLLPTFYDPFANVTLEALACGLPVITTPNNGAGEILLEGETGAVLSYRQPAEDWAEKISLFCTSDVSRREQIRTSCRRVAEQFSLEWHVNQVIALCEKVAQFRKEI